MLLVVGALNYPNSVMNLTFRQIVLATCLTGLVAALVMPAQAARAKTAPIIVITTPKPVVSAF